MNVSTLLAFAFIAFVTVATPGPTVLLALRNGSRHGMRLAAAGIAGAVLSDVLLIAAAGLGLGALLAASETAFSVVKWVGVGYLAFLGVSLLRSRGVAGAAQSDAGNAAGAVFRKSLLVALTNPKGYLFFSALLPQFIAPASPQWPQYALLAAVFALIDGAVMCGYALIGSRAAGGLKQSAARWLDRCCGGALLALAATLAAFRRAT